MEQRSREFHPPPIAAAQLRCLVVGPLRETQANEFGVDAPLGDGARDAVQPGMEQEVRRHREFKIKRRLLENDAKPRQRGDRVTPHVVTHHRDSPGI